MSEEKVVSSSAKKDVLCWNCEGPVVLHPLREEKKHPHPENSYRCFECEEDVILCDKCGNTSCEWFYDLGELWEDILVVGNKPYCPGCWQNDPDIWERHKKEKKEFESRLFGLSFAYMLSGMMTPKKAKLEIEGLPLDEEQKRPFLIKKICELLPDARISTQTLEEMHKTQLASVDKHDNVKRCDCGEVAVIRTIRKEGKNKGKKFWGCPRFGKGKSCGFFKLYED